MSAALGAALIIAGVPASASFAAEKPILGDMTVDNEAPVQWVRDALVRYQRATGRWPADLGTLVASAEKDPQPIDMTAFADARYSVETRDGAAVALFEFTMAGTGAKGAFAVSFFEVR
ncbi:hypothetical protein L2U69_10080 [Zavarzinia compransoris]|uniref:hypothetical protein n=1 Tax=Zavarzinia marina TaxID=2911065 RepID=UPI001F3055C1|nr:hypothetical protein [Zavarzinia marina]MCF4165991.1 hypothetical protein [Zavarzinia marina]